MVDLMSWKDQTRRRRAAERRGRRGGRRASAMLLRQVVLHPVDVPVVIGVDLASGDDMHAVAIMRGSELIYLGDGSEAE
jgi:hypothetical protein